MSEILKRMIDKGEGCKENDIGGIKNETKCRYQRSD
jgi:hypothetical protein